MAAKDTLWQFVDAVNSRDFVVLNEILTSDFHGYSAQGDEPTAPEATIAVAEALADGFPDFVLQLADVVEDGDEARGLMTVRGTFAGELWAVPGDGSVFEFAATVVARGAVGPSGEPQIALRWEGAELIPTLRTLGIMPMPENAHLRPEHPSRPPEFIFKLAFNGMKLAEKPCTHLDQIKMVDPVTDVCQACVDVGTEWPALQMCLTCGFTGCCDTSGHKHAKGHAEETGHALFRSIVPGESWAWCYEDHALLGSRHLQGRG
jgi:hypothetical protein